MLFAASEAAPIARVGGLAEAASGLIRAFRRQEAVELTVVLPDYGDVPLENETRHALAVPEWVGDASVRAGEAPELGSVTLVSVPGIERPHPYVDESGEGWSDNDRRFFGFSAAVAGIANEGEFDLVHANDWHTAAALAMTDLPSVLTIHTLGYQGWASADWADVIGGPSIGAYVRHGGFNPIAGAVALADKVVAVSPSYADEIRIPSRGEGLADLLVGRGDDLIGVCNGIDTDLWDPLTDPHLESHFDMSSLDVKAQNTARLLARAGWVAGDDPIIGVVTRMVDQKGLDLILGAMPYLDGIGARLFMLGSGDQRLVMWAQELARAYPEQFHFVDRYDLELAHLIFAGADLLAMPSRFEPCGLAQMQAMRYGTIPVVTPVGGLLDTVVDADDNYETGNGFVARAVDGAGFIDAVHRGVRAWRSASRRREIQRRGMGADWSWDEPMARYLEIYRSVSEHR